MQQNLWDALVIGGGPAGLSAALMLARARRRVLVIDAGSPRNRFAMHMHGVLGDEGTSPFDLIARGRTEASHYGAQVTNGTVARVERLESGRRITMADGAVHDARALVIATGLSDELPPVPGLAEKWGTTVLHCPYCHGWEVRDQRLGVLTTSPLGLHQAELIRQWSDRVTVFSAGLGALTTETEQRLRSRGVVLEPARVSQLVGDGTALSAARLEDGREIAVDAVFTVGVPRPHDDFLAPLRLNRNDTALGSFLAVDVTGRTSDDRIWAVGNVVSPTATVPASIGAGAMTGAAVNAALVGWDFDEAARASTWPEVATVDFWEMRYTASERAWSGRVNPVLADVAATLEPGRALDIGCGEGADVIWLAEQGWKVTGSDVSSTAIARAHTAAVERGLDDDRVRLVVGDLGGLDDETYDLVTVSYLHSPAVRSRTTILRAAVERVAPYGHLLITSHVVAPGTARAPHPHAQLLPTPGEELASLALDAEDWDILVVETRARDAHSVKPEAGHADDGVILARRRGCRSPNRRAS